MFDNNSLISDLKKVNNNKIVIKTIIQIFKKSFVKIVKSVKLNKKPIMNTINIIPEVNHINFIFKINL